MKKILSLLLLASGMIFFLSCGDDDDGDPSDSGVTISGIPPSASVQPGETLGPVTATVSAPDGLNQLVITKNGSNFATESLSGTSATYDFSYTPLASEEGTTVAFVFSVTDTDGDQATAVHLLTVGETVTQIRVDDDITSDVTWPTGATVILGDRIAVTNGATLTIEPGVVVKGEAGSGANASALLISQNGSIDAQGTAQLPIIFTTIADEITPADLAAGNIASPNLSPSVDGLWGGLIVLGEAPISVAGDGLTAQIEGIPPSDQNGLYGGDDPTDNSGTLRYISIRHGGANIGEGNEINGLTLGGVGSGTTIEFVEIVANQDDGIEPFGGTVDVSNILVWGQGDDAYDCDQNYTGTISNFVYIGGDNSDHAMELDGPEGSEATVNEGDEFVLTNGSLKGGSVGEYIDFRDGVACKINDSYFFGFNSSADVELDEDDPDDVGVNGEGYTGPNWDDMSIDVTNLEFNPPASGNTTIAQIFSDRGVSNGADDSFANRPPDASIVSEPSQGLGATIADFTGWTWADANGELDDF